VRALFEKVELGEQRSLLVKHLIMPYFDVPWHYHPEYELTYIHRGRGNRFVGDHIEPFVDGDLALFGSNLPHFWRNDESFYQRQDPTATEAVVVQFSRELGDQWIRQLPEARSLAQLLTRSQYGLRFSPERVEKVRLPIYELLSAEGFDRLMLLLRILSVLAGDSEAVMLASDNYELTVSQADTERMKRVLEYTLSHFREEIRIDDIASVAGLAPAAFCRYFRKRTRKSFVEYLNELRISHARKLLAEADISVGQVGLECGFNNISHFHRQFKLHTGTTPLRYQAMQKNL